MHPPLEKFSAWHEFPSGRWLLLRRPSRYLGAARNEAARMRLEDISFFDDDNCLKRHSLSTPLRCSCIARACADEPEREVAITRGTAHGSRRSAHRALAASGDAAAVGIFKNCFGDASARSGVTFEALGGFTEDGGVGHEDWELWARAVLWVSSARSPRGPLLVSRWRARSMLAESLGGTRLARRSAMPTTRATFTYLQRLKRWPEAQHCASRKACILRLHDVPWDSAAALTLSHVTCSICLIMMPIHVLFLLPAARG